MKLTQFVKESPAGSYRAEIHQHRTGYSVQYFGPTGELLKTEDCSGQSIGQVSNLAESWLAGIQTLNG